MEERNGCLKYLLIGCGCVTLFLIVLIAVLVALGYWGWQKFKEISYTPPPVVEIASYVSQPEIVNFLIGADYDEKTIRKLRNVTLSEGEINYHLEQLHKEQKEYLRALMDIQENQMQVYFEMLLPEEMPQQVPGFFKGFRMSFIYEGIRLHKRNGTLYLFAQSLRMGEKGSIPLTGYTPPERSYISATVLSNLWDLLNTNAWKLPEQVKEITMRENQLSLTLKF